MSLRWCPGEHCRDPKPPEDFMSPLGRRSYELCSECRLEATRALNRAKALRWRERHLEAAREQERGRKHHAYHHDGDSKLRNLEHSEAWRLNNPDRYRAILRDWKERNREHVRAYAREYNRQRREAS